MLGHKLRIPTAEEALPGGCEAIPVAPRHLVLGTPMQPPAETLAGLEVGLFGMGCFWGAERLFWESGVYSTAVGYAAGHTPNPSYEQVCSGGTGHSEVVRVLFDPARVSYPALLKAFWENHDPTQGMQQGNDRGTQYRSGIYTSSDQQMKSAEGSREAFAKILSEAGYGEITTEVLAASEFYFAEDYHQQYLAKNPTGYCGMGGTGLRLSE
jgi:peptide-methionine (S)-S-oxide reductase